MCHSCNQYLDYTSSTVAENSCDDDIKVFSHRCNQKSSQNFEVTIPAAISPVGVSFEGKKKVECIAQSNFAARLILGNQKGGKHGQVNFKRTTNASRENEEIAHYVFFRYFRPEVVYL